MYIKLFNNQDKPPVVMQPTDGLFIGRFYNTLIQLNLHVARYQRHRFLLRIPLSFE